MPVLHRRDPVANLRKPLVIGHRGAAGLAPENTLAAFRLAIALGVDGVEMDVQLSADGYPVVIHDARVNRTTNGKGTVSRLPLEQLQRLDAGSWFERRRIRRSRVPPTARRKSAETGDSPANFSGEPLPTLEAALVLLSAARLDRIYVELKARRGNEQALVDAVLSLVRKLQVERSVTLLSFDHEIVRRAKEIEGKIRTAATFPAGRRRLISTRSIIRAAESAKVDEVALHIGIVTRRTVEALHERGFSVSGWTANSRLTMRRLAACGVDSIMSDFPGRLREVLESPKRRRVLRLRRLTGR